MAFTLKDSTINFLKENPLLLEAFSEEAISPRVYENASEKAVFFGTGLSTRKAPSEGLPFDFVSYMMSAEELRRHFGFSKIYHIVADVHALSNPFIDKDYVEQLAQRVTQQARDAAKKIGLDGVYEVKLASEFHRTPEFQEIYVDTKKKVEALGLPDNAFDYVHAQIADMEYFVKHMNAGLKLSWILDPKKAREGKGFDERVFDRSYKDIFGSDRLSIAYTVSGFTADPSRSRVSPYTFAPGEQRVLMRSDIDISQFFTAIKALENGENKGHKKTAKNVLDHMANVVAQFERVCGPVEGRDLDKKVTGIIKRFFLSSEQSPKFELNGDFVATTTNKGKVENGALISKKLHDNAEIIEPREGLSKKLAKGKPLTIKLGFDPTSPDLHLGHAVVLKKMKEFQDAGHKIVIIIGDYTARIGDPTGRNSTRPELTESEIKDNARTYIKQLDKILDVNKIEVRFNSEWFDRKNLADILKLMAQTTLVQILERKDFTNRYSKGLPIHMHEMIYPLLQGTDSVEIKADVEMGGTDQLFNNMMGRHLQERFGQEGQVVVCMPILPGLDGVEKMSKSKNNYIGLTDSPEQMYGKVMSIPDESLPQYIDLTTSFPKSSRELMKAVLIEGSTNPMDVKMKVAYNVTEQYHGKEGAEYAADHFDRNVRNKISAKRDFEQVRFDDIAQGKDAVSIIEICKRIRPEDSANQIRRLIKGGALRIDNQKIEDVNMEIAAEGNDISIQFGKRGLLELVRSNEHGHVQPANPVQKPSDLAL